MFPFNVEEPASAELNDTTAVVYAGDERATIRLDDGLVVAVAPGAPLPPVRASAAAHACGRKLGGQAVASGAGWAILALDRDLLRVSLRGCTPTAATTSAVRGAFATRAGELFVVGTDGVARYRLDDLSLVAAAVPQAATPTWQIDQTAVLADGEIRCNPWPLACRATAGSARLSPIPPDVRVIVEDNPANPPWFALRPTGVQLVDTGGHTLGKVLPVHASAGVAAPDGSLVVLRDDGSAWSVWEVATATQIGTLAADVDVVAVGAAGVGAADSGRLVLLTLQGETTLTATPERYPGLWSVTGAPPVPWTAARPTPGEVLQDPVITTLRPESELASRPRPEIARIDGGAPWIVSTVPLPDLGPMDAARAGFVGIMTLGDGWERDRKTEALLDERVSSASGFSDKEDGIATSLAGAEALLVANGRILARGTRAEMVAALPRVGLDRLDVPLPPVAQAPVQFSINAGYYGSGDVFATPDGGVWVGLHDASARVEPDLKPRTLIGAVVGLVDGEPVLEAGEQVWREGHWATSGWKATMRGAFVRIGEGGEGHLIDARTGALVADSRAETAGPRGPTVLRDPRGVWFCARDVDDQSLGCTRPPGDSSLWDEGSVAAMGRTLVVIDSEGQLRASRDGKDLWRHTGFVPGRVRPVDARRVIAQVGSEVGPWVLVDERGALVAAWELGDDVDYAGGYLWGLGGDTLRRVEVAP